MNDAHLHLQDERFKDTESLISKMLESGVKRCVVNGTHPDDWHRVQELSTKHPDLILPSYGLHPWQTPAADDNWKSKLKELVKDSPQHCIGECGLDRWIENPDKAAQEDAFLFQLELANKYNAPLSIHILKAWGWFTDLLRTHSFPKRGFLLHSYNGSAELIDELVKHGAYFSFSGHFLHDKKAKQLDVFKRIPLNRLLLETDAPDMLPPVSVVSHKIQDTPQLNHPANIHSIAEHLAKHLKIEFDKFSSLLDSNFNHFFLTR